MQSRPGRSSATPFALLGLLSQGPGSGYDLKRRAEGSVGHFWSESYGQIYPTLKRLRSKGLVTCAVKARAGKPDRLVYTITRAGSKALKDWLAATPPGEPFRSALLLKLFFGDQVDPAISSGHLSSVRSEELDRLKHYDRVEQDIRRRYAGARGMPYWLATLSYGRHRSRAIVDWADETLRRLEAGAKK